MKANIESRQFDAERLRPWERDPHYYGQTLAASLASQAIFSFAPETDRARRLLSKLRQVPRLVQAARDNIKDPPAIFVKTGIDTFRGIVTFIDSDLPRAFWAASMTCTCWPTWPMRPPKPRPRCRSTPSSSKPTCGPRPRRRSAWEATSSSGS